MGLTSKQYGRTILAMSTACPQILAIVYSDGLAADRFISDLGYALRDAGIAIAGLVQHNAFLRDRTKCNMELEELASGRVLQLSEDRGREARGCRLDRAALAEAAALLTSSVRNGATPELVILNKFGKLEAEGGGLRDPLADIVELGIPILVGVPYRNVEQWRAFAQDMAGECPVGSAGVHEWLYRQGFRINQDAAGPADLSATTNND